MIAETEGKNLLADPALLRPPVKLLDLLASKLSLTFAMGK